MAAPGSPSTNRTPAFLLRCYGGTLRALVQEEPLGVSDLPGWGSSGAVVALTLSEGAIGMVESHDSHDSHDESSAESPVRAADEEPTELHGEESEQSGGPGAGPEGSDREDAHQAPEAQDDE